MTTYAATVLVTAIGGGGHGEQIVKALRLAERRYRIVGADVSPLCPQFNLVDEAVLLPRANDPDYLDRLFEVCRRFGVQAVFHGCEPELLVFHRNRQRFADAGLLLPINPADVIETCMDKSATAAFLSGTPHAPPRTLTFDSREGLDRVDFFPVVVKPSRGGGGSRDTFIAQTPRQLELLAEYIGIGSETFVVQEYVGTPQDEFTVGVLHDMDGHFLNSIAVHRLLAGALNIRSSTANITGRTELGPRLVVSSGISHGLIDTFPEVRRQCEEIARALGARGPINLQGRFVGGRFRVFEINPRFSGTTSLRAMVGYNEPDLLLRRHLLGETIEPHFAYRTGWILRSLTETLIDAARADALTHEYAERTRK